MPFSIFIDVCTLHQFPARWNLNKIFKYLNKMILKKTVYIYNKIKVLKNDRDIHFFCVLIFCRNKIHNSDLIFWCLKEFALIKMEFKLKKFLFKLPLFSRAIFTEPPLYKSDTMNVSISRGCTSTYMNARPISLPWSSFCVTADGTVAATA